MNVQSVTHLIFLLAWALLGFEVIRSLMKLAKLSRPIVGYAAAAVAISFFLGATGPLAWNFGSSSAMVQANAPVPVSAQRVFACPAHAVVSSRPGPGFIDAVGLGAAPPGPKPNAINVRAGTAVHLNGWASLKNGPGTTICAIDNGRAVAGPVTYGIYRPDVAAATGLPGNSTTGYSITVKPSTGTHILAVGAVESDGHSIDKLSSGTLVVRVH